MRNPDLTIFYQFDPWDASIGGIQTIVRYFIKFAPDDLNLKLVGTQSDPEGPIGEWLHRELDGRAIDFFPLFHLPDDDARKLIPTSVRYTWSLLWQNFSGDFLHFHRIEPTLATARWRGHKTLFVHNDIHQQIQAQDVDEGILWKRFPKVYFALEKRLISQFDRVLSCNSESTELYKAQYPEFADRVASYRNTFDGDRFYPFDAPEREQRRQAYAAERGQPSDTRYLLFAGRLHPQKDPLLLIRSMHHVAPQTVHLLIAGAGELAETMREEIRAQGLETRVTMLGPVAQQELADLHRISSAFVLSSAYEGLPLVVLEALACGTPIVTTRAGETPRLLSPDSGVVCEERTPEALGQSIQQVLADPARYSALACTDNAAPYSAKTVIQKIYDDMLASWTPS
ncbi:MAG: glycosyltransferase family 4 protein [Pseudomonadota bacterium]